MANYVLELQEEKRKAARPIGAETKPKAKTANLGNGSSVEEEYMIGGERHVIARALGREKLGATEGEGWVSDMTPVPQKVRRHWKRAEEEECRSGASLLALRKEQGPDFKQQT